MATSWDVNTPQGRDALERFLMEQNDEPTATALAVAKALEEMDSQAGWDGA